MSMTSLIGLPRLLPSIICLFHLCLYSSTCSHVIDAPKDFDWEEHEDQLSWKFHSFLRMMKVALRMVAGLMGTSQGSSDCVWILAGLQDFLSSVTPNLASRLHSSTRI